MEAQNWLVNSVTSTVTFVLLVCYQPYWDMAGFSYSLTEIVTIQHELSASTISWWKFWAHWGLTIASYGPIVVPYLFGLS